MPVGAIHLAMRGRGTRRLPGLVPADLVRFVARPERIACLVNDRASARWRLASSPAQPGSAS